MFEKSIPLALLAPWLRNGLPTPKKLNEFKHNNTQANIQRTSHIELSLYGDKELTSCPKKEQMNRP
jgi:hypothetical protein